jgi:hypothetical protein
VGRGSGHWGLDASSNGCLGVRVQRRRVMHGKGFRCATVREMRLHGRRLWEGEANGGELGLKRGAVLKGVRV